VNRVFLNCYYHTHLEDPILSGVSVAPAAQVLTSSMLSELRSWSGLLWHTKFHRNQLIGSIFESYFSLSLRKERTPKMFEQFENWTRFFCNITFTSETWRLLFLKKFYLNIRIRIHAFWSHLFPFCTLVLLNVTCKILVHTKLYHDFGRCVHELKF